MKKMKAVLAIALMAVMLMMALTACGGSKDTADKNAKQSDAVSTTEEPKGDILTGTWRQEDKVNGNWTWVFDGNGGCKLDGETTGFKTTGTYKLDEAAKTVTVNMEGWDSAAVYNYTLTDTTLDLDSALSTYHLVKQ